MRVRMKSIIAGPNINASPGDIIDVAQAFAYALIESGAAEQIDDDPPRKAAAIVQPETAAMPPAKPRNPAKAAGGR